MSEKQGEVSRRVVLITGATGGIGKAIALKFAAEGWDLICHYFSSKAKAASLEDEIASMGGRCFLESADLSSEKDLERFLGRLRRYLRIDSLINNAGTPVVNECFINLDLPEIKKSFMINTFAPILLCSRTFPLMKKRRFGRIVNISSIAAKYGGSRYTLHYGASKRALEGITKTIAREGAGYNVLVNTIRPGVIDTDFYNKFPKNLRKRTARIPLKRMGLPSDIAEMAYYLGSERNNFITNETIAVAGGE